MIWNRNTSGGNRDAGRGRRNVPFVLFVAFVPLAFLCGIALWLAISRDEEPERGEARPSSRHDGRPIAEVKPAAAARPVTNPAPVCAHQEPAASRPAAKEEPEIQPALLKSEVVEEGLIICEVPSNMPSHLRNPYKSQVESLLSMLGKPGTPYTPVPIDPNMDLEDDFLKAMENTIVIWEDETEQSALRKQMVNWMKNTVAEARKEGWKVGDFLKALEEERKHQWEMLSNAQTVLSETEESMPEYTTEVREALNRELDAAGVDPIKKREVEDEVPQQEFNPMNKNEALQEDTQQ